MTLKTQRLEIREVVYATQRAMRPARLHDVIDLEPIGLAQLAVLRVCAPQGFVPAALTFVAIAPFRRAAGERPPMILPKRVGACVAAPRATTLWQFAPAPRTSDARLIGQIADGQQRNALGHVAV